MIYRKEIDGLRALAVIPVLLFHAGYNTFSGGFIGVDVFFVISGYLITSIIVLEKKAGTFNLINFYERRARRILPALFVVIFACLPFAWMWLVPNDMKGFCQSLVAVVVFASNIFFWRKSGYFDTDAELKPLLHTWSLGVEEQYYLLFPIFLLLAWPFGRRALLLILVAVSLASLAFSQWASINAPAAAFYLLPARVWELLIGVFVAFYALRESRQDVTFQVRQFGSVLGLLLVLYAIFAFDRHTPFPSLYTLVPTIGTALIILFATQRTLVAGLLGNRVLVGIGLVSYSAYLWHQPLFVFARYSQAEDPSKLLMATLVIASFTLAYLTWRYVEVPFRKGNKFGRRYIAILCAVSASVLVTIGLAGEFSHGFWELKTTTRLRPILQTASQSPQRACHTSGPDYRKPRDACEYEVGSLRWATIGDSHSVELAYALAEEIKDSGLKLKHFSFSGCIPTFGREVVGSYADCSKWTRETVEYIVADQNIRNVLVSYRIHTAVPGGYNNTNPAMPLAVTVSAEEREQRWKSYVDLLRYLVKNGKHVVLVLQAPQLPKNINDMLFRSADPGGLVLGMRRHRWDERTGFVLNRLYQIPGEVMIVDPTKIFCNDLDCFAARNGVAYYYDGYHMSVAGAALVVDEIMRQHLPLGSLSVKASVFNTSGRTSHSRTPASNPTTGP